MRKVAHTTQEAVLMARHADLGGHHDIEETYIFPYLAQRMPEFKQESGEHVQQRMSLSIAVLREGFLIIESITQIGRYMMAWINMKPT